MPKKRPPHTYGLYQNQAQKLAEVMALYETAFYYEEEDLIEMAQEIVIETLKADRPGFDDEAFVARINEHSGYLKKVRGLKEEE